VGAGFRETCEFACRIAAIGVYSGNAVTATAYRKHPSSCPSAIHAAETTTLPASLSTSDLAPLTQPPTLPVCLKYGKLLMPVKFRQVEPDGDVGVNDMFGKPP